MEVNKYCLLCNEKLSGRIDKKFCSDYCRTQYHNVRNKLSADLIRKINTILKRNRRILTELNPVTCSNATLHSKFPSFMWLSGLMHKEWHNIWELFQ